MPGVCGGVGARIRIRTIGTSTHTASGTIVAALGPAGHDETVAPVHLTLDEACALLGLGAIALAEHMEGCAVGRVHEALRHHGALRSPRACIRVDVDLDNTAAAGGTWVISTLIFMVRG